ncbi:L-threonylcarbamoyladenylate synthase type 1 TsaC [Idiomarina sp. OT37-5b]|jgi:L-threonylcarbamoyladenylate synthase|uniref:Threonylcarbamoyl-AMP synthase n=1 Tax=Idiomarina aquatica TaxID=1327752 RepID=A0AA94EIE5_9GAMM|nr:MULTISPECIES: Sua5/YciO/YrdC/YwlC family protein [Idiomarina]AVJ54835.1 L-threonylcarbamoyladenylate synthase type 1 TsaC [Idiomarina sp. OT37-5b]RUO45650.1 L-threonylcarbamoyladenylate synthase type 1 TsaC [Idiomarina aquatica]
MFDPKDVREALLDGVIAYPTEAVFGLGCDPTNDEAIAKILDLKQRPVEKGLILIAADYSQLLPFVDDQAIPQDKRFAVFSHWPGPVTLILPARPSVSHLLTGGRDSIAVRVTAFEPVRELCRKLGTPLVSTSANPAGEEPARTAQEVRDYFGDQLSWIMDEPTGGALSPSTIIDPLTKKVFRTS